MRLQALSRANFLAALLPASVVWPTAADTGFAYQPALSGQDYGKSEMSYEDFTKLPSGLLFKDAKVAKGGASAARGDRVVIDWTGYTIGYFGRPFETRQLRSLDGKEDDFFRFELGAGKVIPALEEGLEGMTEGSVRQLVVPPGIGYPASDPGHGVVGPKPSTFSGQRALDFVLQNRELIDKTLLFNVKVIRVDKPGSNGWKPGSTPT
jgi:hypothetical protein